MLHRTMTYGVFRNFYLNLIFSPSKTSIREPRAARLGFFCSNRRNYHCVKYRTTRTGSLCTALALACGAPNREYIFEFFCLSCSRDRNHIVYLVYRVLLSSCVCTCTCALHLWEGSMRVGSDLKQKQKQKQHLICCT